MLLLQQNLAPAGSFLTFDFNEASGTALASIDARFNVTGTLTTTGTGALQTTAFGIPVAFFSAGQGDSQKSEVVTRPHALANSVTVYLQRTATQGGYKVWHSSTTAIQIRRNGTFATTLTVSAFDYSVSPLTLRADYNASTGVVTVIRNGTVVGTWTDTTPLTGGSPGFGIEDNDAGAGDVLIESWTDRQTAASTGISGTSSLTLGAVTQAAAGTVSVSGASSLTLGPITQASAGTVSVSGASSLTLGSVTQASAGTVALTGASAQTLGAITQAATGTVGAAPIVGTSSLTVGAITGTSSGGVTVTGASSATLAAVTGSAAGAVSIAGSQAATLGSITQAAAGTVSLSGASSQTLGAVTGSAAGAIAVTGASAQTLGTVTQASAGTVRVSGAASQTLGAVAGTAAGSVAIAGASSQTLGAITGSAAGTLTSGVTGASSLTLGAFTGTGAGTVSVSGAAAQTLGAVSQAAAGAVAVVGASSLTLGAVTQAATGSVGFAGTSNLTLGAITSTAAGTVRVSGTQALTLGAVTQAAAGAVAVAGAASQTVGQVTQSAAGTAAVRGSAAQTLGAITGAGSGTVSFAPITGTSSLTLAAILSTTTGQIIVRGTGAATLDQITGSAVGSSGAPTETIVDDTSPFFSALAVTGTWGALSARLLWDEPDEDVLDARALSTEYRATMAAEDWPDITRGDTVTVGAGTYRVRGVDILGDGRLKVVSLMLTAGTGPTTFADDATAAGFFDATEFGRVATFGARTAVVLLDAPDDDVLGGRALSREYAMRYRAADLPGLVREAALTIDGSTYAVREVRRLGDGAVCVADLQLKTGPGPAGFAFDADLSTFFEVPGFAVKARWSGIDAQVLFDLPDGDILGGAAQSAGYRATVRAADWAGIARGASVSIAPHTYTVREVRHVGDGATVELRMTRQ